VRYSQRVGVGVIYVLVWCEFQCMVGTGKLLAVGHVTSCCPAYISGRQPVSPPLVINFWTDKTCQRSRTRRDRLSVKAYIYAEVDYCEYIGRRSFTRLPLRDTATPDDTTSY